MTTPNHEFVDFDVVPGINTKITFQLKDNTGIQVLLEEAEFKFEVYDGGDNLRVSKTTPTTVGVDGEDDGGEVTFTFTGTDALQLMVFGKKAGNFMYRLVVETPEFGQFLGAKGFLTLSEPIFDLASIPGGTGEVLPDGTISVSQPTVMDEDLWYALSGFWRIVVAGQGVLTIDTRDLHGTIELMVDTFYADVLTNQEWYPNPDEFAGKNAVRIKVLSGNFVVKYYP